MGAASMRLRWLLARFQRRGGDLALLSPQPVVARLLYLMDAGQTLTIRLS